MKVPIDEIGCIDLDAPTVPAYEAFVDGSVYWLVCPHNRHDEKTPSNNFWRLPIIHGIWWGVRLAIGMPASEAGGDTAESDNTPKRNPTFACFR